MPTPSIIPVEELTFEQASQELEQVVAALEADSGSLDETLALFARGQDLARRCSALLDLAELRVRTLSGNELAPGEE